MTKDLPDKPLRSKTGKFRARVSGKMQAVLDIMVNEGLPLHIAAQRVDMNIESAKRAFRKPHVKNAYNQQVHQARENAAQMAYLRNLRLSEMAESERLRFDANRWVAGVDGIAPVQKVQGQHHHSHSFAGFEYPTVDVTPGPAQDFASGDGGENNEE